MGTMRAFVALYPDAVAHNAIVAFRDEMRISAPREGYRWAKDDQLHLTLRFMGELPAGRLPDLTDRLKRSCASASRFEAAATFEGAPWKGARVVALRVGSPAGELNELQSPIEADVRACGEQAERKAFHPHITLARIENPGLQPKRNRITVAEWVVREVVLVQSVLGERGASHRVLARFPLQ